MVGMNADPVAKLIQNLEREIYTSTASNEKLVKDFRRWLEKKGYAKSIVSNYPCYIRSLMRNCNIYDEESVMRFLWKKPRRTRQSYVSAYYRFKEFLEEVEG